MEELKGNPQPPRAHREPRPLPPQTAPRGRGRVFVTVRQRVRGRLRAVGGRPAGRARARGAGRGGGRAGGPAAGCGARGGGGEWPAERVPGVEGAPVAMLPP